MKYSDLLVDWLKEAGYTTCFFVAGGNIMHILEACGRKLRAIPVVHEVAAGIATEYFNQVSPGERAFALVTAGPGLTNILTAFAGAWLESREMLVIGGQVKTANLSRGQVRQRGIQEIDGVALVGSISKLSVLVEDTVGKGQFLDWLRGGGSPRKGPVFIELPLDVQARNVSTAEFSRAAPTTVSRVPEAAPGDFARIAQEIRQAERPILLIGGGVDRAAAGRTQFDAMGVPVMTTWNGADRIEAGSPVYFGRPNTWGQRYANILIQQTDLLVGLGTRLGMQQTGFNWQEFVPRGKIIQVDCDKSELNKGHPDVSWPLCADANQVLVYLAQADLGSHEPWLAFCREVKELLPLAEDGNMTGPGYISPYDFAETLSQLCNACDIIVPCSSGGAFTTMYQCFANKAGQIMVSNKGLAAMGYGLSGSIGAAFAGNGRRTILVEGDGGFAQNIQEIGTAAVNRLNLKIFIYDDNGYASIRMTQSNYFGGRYLGCDISTGLGLPNWEKIFAAWDVPVVRIKPGFETDAVFRKLFADEGVAAFIVPIDPKQTYFPKITSRVTETGGMASNPLHRLSPDLDEDLYKKVARYLL